MRTRVVTTSLEMTARDQLVLPRPGGRTLDLRRCEVACPEFSRFLYASVGGDWYWIDRLAWDRQRWLAWLDRPELETWVAYESGTPAGYFELEAQGEGSVEIAYFGLLPQFIGRGLGGPLLTAAIERAWELGGRRVWVHTCTLDHARALANYEGRGFRVFEVEEEEVELPDAPPGPWPGA